jgi:allantoinase
MQLRSHDRFRYSGIHDRPPLEWPGGKRLAVYLAVCVEHFAYGEGLGLSYSPGLAHPNTYNWAWREYGNRVGGWRVAELAREFQLPLSVLLNTACYAHCPDLVRSLKGEAGEIVAHGRTNSEHQNGMAQSQEQSLIAEVTTAIREREGAAPAGWMSPGANPSARTEDLLQGAGYRYTLDWPMDDQPVWMRAGDAHLLSVPYPHEVNDVPAIALHDLSAPEFARMAIDNFDEMRQQARGQCLVYGLTIHTFIVGQPYRLRRFREVLAHMRAFDDVWFTTPSQIAASYARQVPPPSRT